MSDLIATRIPRGSSILLRIVDPEDVSQATGVAARLLTAANGATATAKLYDQALETRLRESEASSATVLNVENVSAWAAGYTVEIELDYAFGTTLSAATVQSVDLTARTITVSPGITGAAARGNRVRRLLRATDAGATSLTLDEYGTPAENDSTWGFQGSIASSWEGVSTVGAEILVELTLAASSNGRTFFELVEIVTSNR